MLSGTSQSAIRGVMYLVPRVMIVKWCNIIVRIGAGLNPDIISIFIMNQAKLQLNLTASHQFRVWKTEFCVCVSWKKPQLQVKITIIVHDKTLLKAAVRNFWPSSG